MTPKVMECKQRILETLEAAIYLRPETPGLTNEELRAALESLGYKAGTIDDAFRVTVNDLEHTDEYISIAPGHWAPIDNFLMPVLKDRRDLRAVDAVVECMRELAEQVTLQKALATSEDILAYGDSKSIPRRNMMVAIRVLHVGGDLAKQKDGRWLLSGSAHSWSLLPSAQMKQNVGRFPSDERTTFEAAFTALKGTLGGTGSAASSPGVDASSKARSNMPTGTPLAGTQPGERQSSNPLRIFISHARVDDKLAKALIDVIEAGLVVPTGAIRCTSVDGYKLEGGDDAPEVLRDNLMVCPVVLAVLTKASLSSSYVLMELGAAWAFKKRAIPLVGPGATLDLPGFFKDINPLKMDHDADMSGMIQTLSKVTGLAETGNMPKVIAALKALAALVAEAAAPGVSARDPFRPSP